MIIFVNFTWCNTNAFTHRGVLSILRFHHTLGVLPTPSSPAPHAKFILAVGTPLTTVSAPTGLNNVNACARSHDSGWRQRPGHYNKPRKNGD